MDGKDPQPLPRGTRPGAWRYLVAGIVHGGMLTFAFPPVGLVHLVFPALLSLAWCAYTTTPRGDSSSRARILPALFLWLGTLPFFLAQQRWLIDVTGLGYLPLCMLLAVYLPVFMLLLTAVRRRLPRIPMAIAFPVLWTGIEMFRGELFMDGYAWFLIAQPLIDSPLAAPGHLGGIYFVGFLLALICGAGLDVADALREGKPLRASAARVWPAGIAALTFIGAMELPGTPQAAPTARVAVVQTNLPQSNNFGWTAAQQLKDMDRFMELTTRAASGQPRPDVIIWPETMKPGISLDETTLRVVEDAGIIYQIRSENGTTKRVADSYFAKTLLEAQRQHGVPMLVGEDAYEDLSFSPREGGGVMIDFKHRYNSVYLLESGSTSPVRYDKIRRTPFGETMPYISYWPWLQDRLLDFAAHGMRLDLSSGQRLTVFEVPVANRPIRSLKVATPICFEVTVTGVCRSLVWEGLGSPRRRAELLVNLTNDGWFGNWDAGRRQHMQLARWRCLELGTPMVRAANTGISCLIDEQGRVTAAGPDGAQTDASGRPIVTNVDGVMTVDVPLRDRGPTVYAATGNIAGWGSLAGTVCLLIGVLRARRTNKGAA
jgi:apolipoprotein N-acyltransferase